MLGTTEPAGPRWRPDPRLLDALSVAAVATDASGEIVYANAAAGTTFGDTLAPLYGEDARERLFEASERDSAGDVLAVVLSGETWSGQLVLAGATGQAAMLTSWSPVHVGDAVTGALLLAEPLPDSSSSVRLLTNRLRRLATVATDLLLAETVDAVSLVITNELTEAAGATAGSFSLLVDDQTLALIGVRGGREGLASRWATYPVAGRTPAGEAVRTGRTIVVTGSDEIRDRYPDLESLGEGVTSLVCLPLTVTGRTMGVVTLSLPSRSSVDAAELQFLGILADTCAQAVTRIRAQEVVADREAKLRFLAEASVRLSSDLDYETTLTAVAEMGVPWFADWCAIALDEDGALRTLSVAHALPQHAALVEEIQTRYPSSPDAPRGAYQVLRSGQSDLAADLSDDLLAAVAQDEEHLRLLRLLDFHSAMVVPLKVRDRVLGVVTWVTGSGGRRFTSEDVAFAEDLAGRAAVAIDNAQLHSQLRDVALRLQRAVLPESLPEGPGWEMAVDYQPAGRTGVGGDFYDVLPLDDGKLAIFVGDVMGRGVEATSTMAQMGSALRTLAAVDPDPETVMAGLDLVFDRLDLEQLVTVVYAVADSVSGQLRVINAGHPGPVILAVDGTTENMDAPETMILGAGGGERSVLTRTLEPGDTLLFFTDGLFERRDEDSDRGMERLIRRSASLPRTSDLAGELARIVGEVRDPTRDDDVAALVLRWQGR